MGALITTSSHGGELISFKIDGIEKIHQGENSRDENGKVYWKRHAPVLFPIVGKLKRNQTLINGRTYEIFQHGFARDMEFEPVTKLDNFHSYVLRSNKYSMARYPFEFDLYLVDGLVGTEYAKNKLVNNKYILLDGHTFDNDAIIIKGIQNKKISLKNKRTGKIVLKMDFEGWPYLGIWSKEGAPFICLEPWTSTADRVNSNNVFVQKPDMIVLEPGKEYENKFSVEFF